MAIQKRLYTPAEFERFLQLPENADKRFELINGEIYEVPSNAYCSEIAMLIVHFLLRFILEHGIAGHVTGEGGGYIVAGARCAPDAAYLSAARQKVLAKQGYNPIAPELAVEVVSPTDKEDELAEKLEKYAAAKVLVWVVYPERKVVEIFSPGKPRKVVGIDGELTGEDVLPGFVLPVHRIFPRES
jgi:Uma2 family endonuclease